MPEWVYGVSFLINFIITYKILKRKVEVNFDNIAVALILGFFAGAFLAVLLESMTNYMLQLIIINVIVCFVYVKILKS